jgi:hypothetical protein
MMNFIEHLSKIWKFKMRFEVSRSKRPEPEADQPLQCYFLLKSHPKYDQRIDQQIKSPKFAEPTFCQKKLAPLLLLKLNILHL